MIYQELKLFNPKDIVQKKWPHLMKWVKNMPTSSKIYLVSKLPDKKASTGTITLLARQLNGWGLYSFTRKGDFEEPMQKVRINDTFATALALTILPDTYHMVETHEKAGRPKKYDRTDAHMLVLLRQRGMTIREIAKLKKMSTATVQKLLNSILSKTDKEIIVERNRRRHLYQ